MAASVALGPDIGGLGAAAEVRGVALGVPDLELYFQEALSVCFGRAHLLDRVGHRRRLALFRFDLGGFQGLPALSARAARR